MKGAVVIATVLFFFSGCIATSPKICNLSQIQAHSFEKIDHNNRELAKRFVPDSKRVILVTTVMNVDRFDEATKSDTLGRFLTENFITALVEEGARVVEIKLRKKILTQKSMGEFALSHDMRNMIRKYRADYLVTGSYTVGSNEVYVNLKMIDLQDHSVTVSGGYLVPIDNDMRKLLGLDPIKPRFCAEY